MYTKCYARAFSDIIRNRLWQTKEGLSKVLPPYECIACINTLCVCAGAGVHCLCKAKIWNYKQAKEAKIILLLSMNVYVVWYGMLCTYL